MPDLPALGTRVVVRYRLAAGSVPPLTDVIGHLLSTAPMVRIRTKSGVVVEVPAEDVVTVRALTDAPVRTSQIRSTEHAAALAWPGLEHRWLQGWLLRAGPTVEADLNHHVNSAVPLQVEASAAALPAIIDWYTERGLTPWLALPDRLLRLPDTAAGLETLVMVADISDIASTASPGIDATLVPQPDTQWRLVSQHDTPADLLTTVVDGEVIFGVTPGAAAGRAAITEAPDGVRWVGLSALHVVDRRRRRGYARGLCTDLLRWGLGRGATLAYAQIPAGNDAAVALGESLGFTMQHRIRYLDARKV